MWGLKLKQMDENKTDIQVLSKTNAGIFFIEVPIKDGFVHFEFSEFEFSGHTQECIIYCWIEIPGHTQDGLTQRINLLSISARKDFVSQLNSSFGKIANWNLIFSNVCVKVGKELASSQVAKSYSDFEPDKNSDVLTPFLRDKSINVFFGMGSSGKTLLTLELGLSVAFNLPFLNQQPKITGNFMFVDYEDSHQTFFERISLLSADKGIEPEELDKRIFRFSPNSVPLHDIKHILKREIINKQIKFLVIDSAVSAAGGEPESAAIATRLFNSLTFLDICVLLICHKTKSEEGDKYPFGSVFFYNFPRNIWYIKKDQELGEDLSHVGLIHRKCNYNKLSTPKAVKIDFEPGSIKITEENNRRWEEDLSIKTRILNSLEESPKTTDDLFKDLNISKSLIKTRLSTLHSNGKIIKPDYGGKWQILYPKELEIQTPPGNFGSN